MLALAGPDLHLDLQVFPTSSLAKRGFAELLDYSLLLPHSLLSSSLSVRLRIFFLATSPHFH